MSREAIQDYYPDVFSHCYGCGRLNDDGLHIKSVWEGDDVVCRFTPEPYHLAVPGIVYGGLIASLIDCHAMATAAAEKYRAEGRDMTTGEFRFMTASLKVDYLRPTPIGTMLELRANATELKDRKVVVEVDCLLPDGAVTARGHVIAVQAPDEIFERLVHGAASGAEA